MATQKVVLTPFNTLTLVAGTQYNLTAPSTGHYNVTLVNWSGGAVAVSNANTVSLSDPGSFTIPIGNNNAADIPYTFRISGTAGLWVAGTGSLSVLLTPSA